jgi:hypothetical protein
MGLHSHIWETANNIEWDNEAIRSTDALLTTSLEGTVVDHILEMFKLWCRVNSTVQAMVGVLSHMDNDWAVMSLDLGGCVNDLEGRKFVVINTGDVNPALMCQVDMSVITYDASVSSPIDEGTALRL